MEKSCKKYALKASPRLLFYFGKQPITAIDILKGVYQKPLKKLTLFFLLNSFPFNGQSYKKQKGLGTEPVPIQVMKQVHKNFFISYILSDQV